MLTNFWNSNNGAMVELDFEFSIYMYTVSLREHIRGALLQVIVLWWIIDVVISEIIVNM